jgi:hypothetical protein
VLPVEDPPRYPAMPKNMASAKKILAEEVKNLDIWHDVLGQILLLIEEEDICGSECHLHLQYSLSYTICLHNYHTAVPHGQVQII